MWLWQGNITMVFNMSIGEKIIFHWCSSNTVSDIFQCNICGTNYYTLIQSANIYNSNKSYSKLERLNIINKYFNCNESWFAMIALPSPQTIPTLINTILTSKVLKLFQIIEALINVSTKYSTNINARSVTYSPDRYSSDRCNRLHGKL